MTLLRIAAVYFWPWILHAIASVALACVALATLDEWENAVGWLVVGTAFIFGPVLVLYPVAQLVLCHHPDRRTSSRAIADGPGVFALICTVWWIALGLGSFGYFLFFIVAGGLPLMLFYVGVGTVLARRLARWHSLLAGAGAVGDGTATSAE